MKNLTPFAVPLTPHQQHLLTQYQQVNFDPNAFSKANNLSLYDALRFIALPPVQAAVAEFDDLFIKAFERTAAQARLFAVQVLRTVLTAATDPIQICRIAALLVRAAKPIGNLRAAPKSSPRSDSPAPDAAPFTQSDREPAADTKPATQRSHPTPPTPPNPAITITPTAARDQKTHQPPPQTPSTPPATPIRVQPAAKSHATSHPANSPEATALSQKIATLIAAAGQPISTLASPPNVSEHPATLLADSLWQLPGPPPRYPNWINQLLT